MGMLVSAPSPKSWPGTFVDSIRLLALPTTSSMHAQDSPQDTHRSSIGPLGWHSNVILHRYYIYRWPTRWRSNHRYYSYRWYSDRPWFWFPKSESWIFFGSRDRREHLSVLLLAAWEKRLMDSNCLQVEFEILGCFLLATMASLRLQDFLRSNLNHLAVKVASHQFLGSYRQTFHRSVPLEFQDTATVHYQGPRIIGDMIRRQTSFPLLGLTQFLFLHHAPIIMNLLWSGIIHSAIDWRHLCSRWKKGSTFQLTVWKQHSWQPQNTDSRTEQRHCKNSVSRKNVWLSLFLRRDTLTEISHGWPRRMRLDDVGSAVHQSKWHNLRFRQGTERDFYIGHAWFSSAVSVFVLVPVFAQTCFPLTFACSGFSLACFTHVAFWCKGFCFRITGLEHLKFISKTATKNSAGNFEVKLGGFPVATKHRWLLFLLCVVGRLQKLTGGLLSRWLLLDCAQMPRRYVQVLCIFYRWGWHLTKTY